MGLRDFPFSQPSARDKGKEGASLALQHLMPESEYFGCSWMKGTGKYVPIDAQNSLTGVHDWEAFLCSDVDTSTSAHGILQTTSAHELAVIDVPDPMATDKCTITHRAPHGYLRTTYDRKLQQSKRICNT